MSSLSMECLGTRKMVERNQKTSNFEWFGSQVECYHKALRNYGYEFYTAFAVNNTKYEVGDFAFINARNDREWDRIGRIMCVYESSQKWHADARYRGLVRWYTWAKNILKKENPEGIELNYSSEVVEDFRGIDKFISLESVRRPCKIIFGVADDRADLIQSSKFDPNVYFLCRFKIDNLSVIIPVDICNVEHNVKESPMKKTPRKVLQKRKSSPINLDSEGSDELEVISGRIKSPTSPNKELRVSARDERKVKEAVSSLVEKQQNVKRNLTESFNDGSNSQSNTPVLNYSIADVSADDSEALKIKLRLSKHQNPMVILHKLEDEIIKRELSSRLNKDEAGSTSSGENSASKGAICQNAIQSCRRTRSKSIHFLESEMTPSLRRSSRVTTKKSYVDYISPVKYTPTPTKRSRSKSTSSVDTHFERAQKIFDDASERGKAKRNTRRPSRYCSPIEEDAAEQSHTLRTPKTPKRSITRSDTVYLVDSSEDAESPGIGARPRRSVKIPLKYLSDESDASPLKSLKFATRTTPIKRSSRKNRKPVKRLDSDDCVDVTKTPKTPRQKIGVSTPKSALKQTPSMRAKLIREGVITPSMQARERAVVHENTPLSKARTKLHVSYVPKALSCREKEFSDVLSFVQGKLSDGCSGCMYVSGVPGTGKTATVTEVIKNLQNSAENGDIPKFTYININGMRLSEPRQAYVEILKQLTGKTFAWGLAQNTLEDKFTKKGRKSTTPLILVVDELDILCTKRQDVVYNLLDWPTKANAQLIVITIANTMDLPERLLMGRITSRLGLTRLTFQAYTYKQLQEIVTKRLTGTRAFNPDAVQLVARKVASVSGDARRALDICRRATEIAEFEGKRTLVAMSHVNEALSAMITQPKVQAIKHCSRLERLLLQAVVSEVERTGVDETNFANVYTMLVSMAALDGFRIVSSSLALAAVSKLGAYRLLLIDSKCSNINQRIVLNVSSDDVYFALQKTDV